MKNLIGFLTLLVSGIILAIWLGIFVCFVGGIVQVIDAVKTTPTDSLGIAFGIVRFFIASFVGWGSFWVSTLIAKIITE